MNPTGPDAISPDPGAPEPWHKPQQPTGTENDNGVSAGDAGNAAGELVGGVADAAGGALEAVGSAADVAGGCAGGCADGCGGCSAAILITLFAAASTAMAFFR